MCYIHLAEQRPAIRLQIDRECVPLEEKDGLCRYRDVEIRLERSGSEMSVYLTADKTPVSRLYLSWRWDAPEGVRVCGDAWERGYGDLEWRGIAPDRVMPWYVLISDREGTNAYGVRTGPAAMCSWRLDRHTIQLCLDVRCGTEPVLLAGRRVPVAVVVSREGRRDESAFAAACAFCRCMCRRPMLPRGPVYGGNNWYYAYGNSSQRQIMKDAVLLAELSEGNAVRPYLVVDDGWQQGKAGAYNGGPWHRGNEKFPDMARLARDIKALGLRPGIWFRPLVTAGRFPDECRLTRSDRPEACVLDPSHPLVLEEVENTVRSLRDWGYELIKHDFTSYDVFGRWGFEMGEELSAGGRRFYDRGRTTAEIIVGLYRAIRRGAGEDTVIIGCNTVSHLAAGIFEIQRTGDDTSGVDWERTRKMGVNTLAFRMPQDQAFYACDADCVGITDEIDWKLNREWLRMLAVSGTPLFVSVDPDTVTEEQKRYIRRAFKTAIVTDRQAEPLNWMQTTCPDVWRTQYGDMRFDLSGFAPFCGGH